jgi:thymidylate synthase ThyX
MDDHAQQEIQDYARCMFEMVKPEVPLATEAFEDYSLNSMSLSRMELSALKYVLKTFPEMQSSSGFTQNITSYMETAFKTTDNVPFDMGKREWKEFLEKMK